MFPLLANNCNFSFMLKTSEILAERDLSRVTLVLFGHKTSVFCSSPKVQHKEVASHRAQGVFRSQSDFDPHQKLASFDKGFLTQDLGFSVSHRRFTTWQLLLTERMECWDHRLTLILFCISAYSEDPIYMLKNVG